MITHLERPHIPTNDIDATSAIGELRTAEAIAIATHIRPDGDAVGSAVGLCRLLREEGKTAFVLDLGTIPDKYAFLVKPSECAPSSSFKKEDFDLLVVVDSGTIDRTPPFVKEWAASLRVLNIDHHISNTHFGHANLIDTDASSTGEIIVILAEQAAESVTEAAAEPLWVALVTDTGRFSYSNTTSRALHVASHLLEHPIPTAKIDHVLHQSASLQRLKLEGRAIDSLHVQHAGKVAYVTLTRKDFTSLGCAPADADEVVNIPRRLETAQVAIFFYELMDEEATKVSVRTVQPHDASALCARFGGGGHMLAAGCSISQPMEQAVRSFLDAVSEAFFPEDPA